MTTLREAAQQAEDVLRGCLEHPDAADAIAALQAALAEPDQPIAWGMPTKDGYIVDVICPEEHARMPGEYTVPLYAAPQPKAEQEPVAWMVTADGEDHKVFMHRESARMWCADEKHRGAPYVFEYKPLYAAPQPRRRLSANEVLNMMPESIPADHDGALMEFARAIEAAVWGDGK
jgi:hypothetical protein